MLKEKYTLRVLRTKLNPTGNFAEELLSNQIENSYFRNPDNTYNITIKISDNTIENEKKFKILTKYNFINTDNNLNLFISFTACEEISGFTIPKYIVEMLKKYFDSVDVSIICLNEK
ncbi:MAG: hypothetical protein QM535_05500 [Limnohabitans sp.]|nr:hypothetical protein [Limnohabitans sp.]